MKRSIFLFFRSIKNNPKTFVINLTGFSIGLIAAMFIFIYVVKETRADRFHEKANDLYRVIETDTNSVTDKESSSVFLPMGNFLMNKYPIIKDYTRIYEHIVDFIETETKERFKNQDVWYVDQSFFELFDFDLSIGDYKQLFNMPNGIIISKDIAKSLFAGSDPIGKTLSFNIVLDTIPSNFTVVGVLKDYPEESTLKPQYIANIETILKSYSRSNQRFNEWAYSAQLFLHIPENRNPEQITSGLSRLVSKEIEQSTSGNFLIDSDRFRFELQPLTDIYLYSSEINDNFLKGDLPLLKILSVIGFVLLLIVSLNYVILTLGLNSKNNKLQNIHYALGGSKFTLLKKLIGDSIIFTTIAFFTALVLYPVVQKFIVNLLGFRYNSFVKSDILIFSSFFLILIIFGIFNGWVQYLFVEKLFHKKALTNVVNKRQWFFNGLIQFQLVLFIGLVISLFFINRQVNHIRNLELGFDARNTYVTGFRDERTADLFKQQFEKQSYINCISSGNQLYRNTYYFDNVKIVGSEKIVISQIIQGDENYLKAHQIKLLEGQNLDISKFPTNAESFSGLNRNGKIIELLVNQEFVRQAGLENPVGTIISNSGEIYRGQIVGVFSDVKNLPLNYSTKPIIIGYDYYAPPGRFAVSVKEGEHNRFLSDFRTFLAEQNLGSFEDQRIWHFDFEKEYKKEQILIKLLNLVSIIAFGIMVLGLIGLSMFIAETKTKEIGIRKVNGAKVLEILTMLNKDFVKWVIIAFAIATPVAYYAMNKWLENFAYKTTLNWWIFALAGLLALGIALLTVSWQSWRAATRNPVEALRYE